MAEDFEDYFQRITICLKGPDGKIRERTFVGIAFSIPEDWKGKDFFITNEGDKKGIYIQEPRPLDELVKTHPDQKDVVDTIRQEAIEYFKKNGEEG